MTRTISCLALLLVAPWNLGCVTCDAPFDNQYSGQGGIVERPHGTQGRANSAFVPTHQNAPAVEPGRPTAAMGMQPLPLTLPVHQREPVYSSGPGEPY